jgi:hypothetical protein
MGKHLSLNFMVDISKMFMGSKAESNFSWIKKSNSLVGQKVVG